MRRQLVIGAERGQRGDKLRKGRRKDEVWDMRHRWGKGQRQGEMNRQTSCRILKRGWMWIRWEWDEGEGEREGQKEWWVKWVKGRNTEGETDRAERTVEEKRRKKIQWNEEESEKVGTEMEGSIAMDAVSQLRTDTWRGEPEGTMKDERSADGGDGFWSRRRRRDIWYLTVSHQPSLQTASYW